MSLGEEHLLKGSRVLGVISGLELFGHERGNIEAYEALRVSGASVFVGVSDRADNHVKMELKQRGFKTFDLPLGPQWSKQWLRKEPSLAIRQVAGVVRCSRRFVDAARSFGATHIQLGSILAYSYVSLSLKQLPLPLIYRMGDTPPVGSQFNYRFWWKPAMARVTKVVANSRFTADAAIVAGVSPEKVHVIYNHPPGRWEGEATPPGCLKTFQSEPMSLLYVGSIAEHKGLVPLVNSLALLRGRGLQIRLHLAGESRWDSGFRTCLESIVRKLALQDSVVWHGFVNDPGPLYKMADLHVAPSIWEEPSGNIVVEAKRAGRPSVVFPSGGLPEHIRHLVDGYICKERTAAALASAILWMLDDKERLASMGWAARNDYETRFGWTRFKEEWANVYVDPAE